MTGGLRNERLEATRKNNVCIYSRTADNIHKNPRGARNNLYEYCALAQKICGFLDDFVGSYGAEEMFFGRLGTC